MILFSHVFFLLFVGRATIDEVFYRSAKLLLLLFGQKVLLYLFCLYLAWQIVVFNCIRFQTLKVLVILGSFLYVEQVLVRHKLSYHTLRDLLCLIKVSYLHHFMIFSIRIVNFIGFLFLSCDTQDWLPLMLSQHHF